VGTKKGGLKGRSSGTKRVLGRTEKAGLVLGSILSTGKGSETTREGGEDTSEFRPVQGGRRVQWLERVGGVCSGSV